MPSNPKASRPILNLSVIHKDMTKDGVEHSFTENLEYALAKDQYTSTPHDQYLATAIAIRDRLVERWIMTQQRYHRENIRRVYYFSMEFLMGRLLGTNVYNLGLQNDVGEALSDLGIDLESVRECEVDAGLGNAGLGRLAACFLDSMATLGIPAHGYGIRYEYGIFNQKISDGFQVEYPDDWLRHGDPWEFMRPEYVVKVKFYGRAYMENDKNGKLKSRWVDTQDVIAMPYDIPIPGYRNDIVNTLRLWSARSTAEFDLSYFNEGDYERAVYNKVLSENISKVLYPSDNVSHGKELRLKQEYFFTASSLADIIRRFKLDNKDMRRLPEKAVVQLNDTHPAISIPELMRILLDDFDLDWDTAWDVTVRTFAYTNHTIMPEAIESWPVPLFEKLLPRHLQIIYEINSRFMREISIKFPGDTERMRRMSIIDEGDTKRVRMGHLAVIGSHSVNGVSELHSHLLKTQLFRDFYELQPEKFNNKTNGITQRRWLEKSNTKLSSLITDTIGNKWTTNLFELKKILAYKEDASFRNKWQKIKEDNKKALANYIYLQTGIPIDPHSMFDIQVKRIHEYKRQLLFVFYIISEYLRIKSQARYSAQPRTFIFSGKAAPGYFMAKLIIKFITSVADVINNDRDLDGKIKVVFLENYRVSLAERIFPGSDLSEQISTAGTEASGTGCMKFMVNGALTIGTYDGANIEIAEAVGAENIFIFGLRAEEVINLHRAGYNPMEYVENSTALKEIFHLIKSNFFSQFSPGIFEPIYNNLSYSDYFYVCADFESYCAMQKKVSKEYSDRTLWTKKSITNVAKAGKFSSDRTIQEYADDIWKVPYNKRG